MMTIKIPMKKKPSKGGKKLTANRTLALKRSPAKDPAVDSPQKIEEFSFTKHLINPLLAAGFRG